MRQRLVSFRRSRRSLDHGCGAHSEVDLVREDPKPAEEPVLDEFAFDVV
jgi:hypothetical protein